MRYVVSGAWIDTWRVPRKELHTHERLSTDVVDSPVVTLGTASVYCASGVAFLLIAVTPYGSSQPSCPRAEGPHWRGERSGRAHGSCTGGLT